MSVLADPIVRSGLSFGCYVTATLGLIAAAVSVPVRWIQRRNGGGER